MVGSSVVTLPIQDSSLQSSPDDHECFASFCMYRENKEMSNGADKKGIAISNTVIGSDGTKRCALIVFCKMLEVFCITL